jgi:hypothetical protein
MSVFDDLLNIRQASELCGVSEQTIRNYLGLGKTPKTPKLPNARKVLLDGNLQEVWQIPVSDLFNAGLMKKAPAKVKAEVAEVLDDKDQVAQLQKQLDDLASELKDQKHRAELAEQKVIGLEQTLSVAMKALEWINPDEPTKAPKSRFRLFKR